ncbi:MULTISPECIES: FAD binding domain-containing protein [Halococcus]|jgi:carbon-monoxide dehydrogenase medium subunit|uniref:Molybdopterin dehydrogenase FAD-binding protein n=1 Tax=Halococcus salifodinae DSM 8989 TaxID=1227456 RepID=M0MQZ8_9EURY|nr:MULTISPECIES: xanthine dehydrogenase family protein subunit M [Halococcus]EMA48147.1 molybdopterin dehydrogenase FAD-binding protein [Halococcus salifodinae DSM 8989]
MYPDEFDYYTAESVGEALDLLDEHSDAETELLAGGHSLLPAMKTGLSSPEVLIDISGVDAMHGIEVDDDTLSIGAMERYSALTDSDEVAEHAPALAAAAQQVGDVQVRNRGTLGGNLAHADPAADLPAAALASNVTLVAEGPDGERSIPADDFFFGMYATDLTPDELLTRVEIPSADGAVGTYAKKPSPSSGYAMVGVAALLDTDDDTVESASVGANGVMDHGVRLESVEDALAGGSLDDDSIEAAAGHAGDDLDVAMMMDDLQASNEFRAQLLEVYTERALTSAMDADSASAAAD